jgi:ABC-type Mn2+/Zn2+ transport system ATPase subunit
LIISHELNIVAQMAHQVICLNRRLYGIGPPLHTLTPEILLQLYGSTAALYWHNHSHEEPS